MRCTVFLLTFFVCVNYVLTKSVGEYIACPNYDIVNVNSPFCVENCTSDMNCPNDKICCPTGCGHVCWRPNDGVYKPGTCPARPVSGTCAITCESDFNCKNDSKCCSNGCGRTCQAPEPPEKPGYCPELTGPIGPCSDKCTCDLNCKANLKCCYNGCGHNCTRPVSTSPKNPPEQKPMTIKD